MINQLKSEIGHGEFGACYFDENGNVIKVYNSISSSLISSELIGIKNDTYIFPFKIIYSNGTPIATLTKYINSPNLDNKDLLISDLINSIPVVYEDTDRISDLKIETNDVRSQNMLYTDSIKIIDSDFYKISDKPNIEIISHNISQFNYGIIKYILSSNPKILNNDKELQEFFFQLTLSNDNRYLIEFLLFLKKKLESQFSCNISTCSKCRKLSLM